MMTKKSFFLIIPGYNEEKRIAAVLKKARKYSSNIIVVDDGSQDKTFDVAQKYTPYVLRHSINLGKGAAMKTGAEYAIKKGAKQIIFMDSDGQHRPEDIPRFVKELKKSDIVFGSRELNKKMPGILKFGNNFISKTNSILFGVKLRDATSGFRAMNAGAYKKIRWVSSGYSVEAEMIANAGKQKLKYKEITIKTIYSDSYKGTTVIDGIKIVLNMIWFKISRW